MIVELIASMDQALCLMLFNSGDEFRLRDFKKATAIGKCHLEPARKAQVNLDMTDHCATDFCI